MSRKATKESFEQMFRVTPGCWIWEKHKNEHGYGRVRFQGVLWLANRLAYTLYVGPIPHGMCVLHKCDNPACVNPDHLFLGTHKDNMTDRKLKERFYSTLTSEDVLKIREDNRPQHEIAKAYGVVQATISCIKLRKTWSHI